MCRFELLGAFLLLIRDVKDWLRPQPADGADNPWATLSQAALTWLATQLTHPPPLAP